MGHTLNISKMPCISVGSLPQRNWGSDCSRELHCNIQSISCEQNHSQALSKNSWSGLRSSNIGSIVFLLDMHIGYCTLYPPHICTKNSHHLPNILQPPNQSLAPWLVNEVSSRPIALKNTNRTGVNSSDLMTLNMKWGKGVDKDTHI